MNSARQIKLRLAEARPRNPLVVPAARRKAGKHRKSASGERQAGQRQLRRELRDQP